MKFTLFVLIAVFGLFRGGFTQDVDNPCMSDQALPFNPHPFDETKFIQCASGGRMFIQTCPDGLVWNVKLSRCGNPDKTKSFQIVTTEVKRPVDTSKPTDVIMRRIKGSKTGLRKDQTLVGQQTLSDTTTTETTSQANPWDFPTPIDNGLQFGQTTQQQQPAQPQRITSKGNSRQVDLSSVNVGGFVPVTSSTDDINKLVDSLKGALQQLALNQDVSLPIDLTNLKDLKGLIEKFTDQSAFVVPEISAEPPTANSGRATVKRPVGKQQQRPSVKDLQVPQQPLPQQQPVISKPATTIVTTDVTCNRIEISGSLLQLVNGVYTQVSIQSQQPMWKRAGNPIRPGLIVALPKGWCLTMSFSLFTEDATTPSIIDQNCPDLACCLLVSDISDARHIADPQRSWLMNAFQQKGTRDENIKFACSSDTTTPSKPIAPSTQFTQQPPFRTDSTQIGGNVPVTDFQTGLGGSMDTMMQQQPQQPVQQNGFQMIQPQQPTQQTGFQPQQPQQTGFQMIQPQQQTGFQMTQQPTQQTSFQMIQQQPTQISQFPDQSFQQQRQQQSSQFVDFSSVPQSQLTQFSGLPTQTASQPTQFQNFPTFTVQQPQQVTGFQPSQQLQQPTQFVQTIPQQPAQPQVPTSQVVSQPTTPQSGSGRFGGNLGRTKTVARSDNTPVASTPVDNTPTQSSSFSFIPVTDCSMVRCSNDFTCVTRNKCSTCNPACNPKGNLVDQNVVPITCMNVMCPGNSKCALDSRDQLIKCVAM